jgi:hypothetical protein
MSAKTPDAAGEWLIERYHQMKDCRPVRSACPA